MSNACAWMYSDPDYGGWTSDCGYDFHFEDGSPTENGMKFCCGCGKPLVEKNNPLIDYEFNEWKGEE